MCGRGQSGKILPTVDEWPSLLYALLGSAVGGFFGAWLQIRHERREQFRQLMLGAATDAATSLERALHATRIARIDATCFICGAADRISNASRSRSFSATEVAARFATAQ